MQDAGGAVDAGCGWLWMVVDGCGWLWMVVDGCGRNFRFFFLVPPAETCSGTMSTRPRLAALIIFSRISPFDSAPDPSHAMD